MATPSSNLQQPDPLHFQQADATSQVLKKQPPLPQDKQVADVKNTALQNTQNPQAEDIKNKGNVIVLTGIVAAGKSSIVKAVQKVDPAFHEEDLDLRRDPKTPTTDEMELAMIDDTINRSLAGKDNH